MAVDEVPPLPWEELKEAGKALPWAALEQIAEAVAGNPFVLDRLKAVYYESEPYDLASYEGLFTPAILAMAAPRMSDPVRQRAVEFVVKELAGVGEPSLDEIMRGTSHVGLDELTEGMFERAAGLLGPSVLPEAVAAMERDRKAPEQAFGLWCVLTLAAESQDEGLRQRIIALAEKALQKELEKDEPGEIVWPVAHVLSALGHKPARGLIEAMRRKTPFWRSEETLRILDGFQPAEPVGLWTEPLKDAITSDWESLRDWFAEIDAMPSPGDEDEDEDVDDGEDAPDDEDEFDDDDSGAAERRADELTNRFVASAAFAELPEETRSHAGFVAYNVLVYASTYEGAAPEELNDRVLGEVLMEIFPRKISADPEVFKNAAPAAAALVRWLGSEGILKDADRLANRVAKWSDEIVANAADESRWGPAKGFMMFAMAKGIDPTDREGMDKAMLEFNLRLTAPRIEAPPDEDIFALPPGETIVRDSPKVGRNDPCPCGSGKKYKKCCGRP